MSETKNHLSNTNCDLNIMSSLNEKNTRMHNYLSRQNQKIDLLNKEKVGSTGTGRTWMEKLSEK